MMEWYGRTFDPTYFDTSAVNLALNSIKL